MDNELVTIATFQSPVEASIAKSCLEAEGMDAFLADEAAVAMNWDLTNALGGIKLQVRMRQSEQAAAILAESKRSAASALDQTADGHNIAEPEELEPVPSSRERDVDRALKCLILGLLLPPLEAYAVWLLFKVFLSTEPLDPVKRRYAVIAAVVAVSLAIAFCFMGAARWFDLG
jgi:hypothetical protein